MVGVVRDAGCDGEELHCREFVFVGPEAAFDDALHRPSTDKVFRLVQLLHDGIPIYIGREGFAQLLEHRKASLHGLVEQTLGDEGEHVGMLCAELVLNGLALRKNGLQR